MRYLLSTLFWLVPALGFSEDADDLFFYELLAEEKGPSWVLEGALDVDEEGGLATGAAVTWLPGPDTFVSANIGLSDSAADLANFDASYVSLAVDHTFGVIGGSLSTGWATDGELVERFKWGGSVYVDTGPLRVELMAEDANGDFDPFEFSRLIERDGGLPPVLLTGRAECELDNTALGGRVSVRGERWSVYGSYTDYDYDEADCRLQATLGDIDLRSAPAALTDFAPLLFRRLSIATASQIVNADATFLRRSYGAGGAYQLGDRRLGLDYFHSEEVFFGQTADTVIGSLLLRTGARTDLEVRLGFTDHEDAGSVAFAGVSALWYIGGD